MSRVKVYKPSKQPVRGNSSGYGLKSPFLVSLHVCPVKEQLLTSEALIPFVSVWLVEDWLAKPLNTLFTKASCDNKNSFVSSEAKPFCRDCTRNNFPHRYVVCYYRTQSVRAVHVNPDKGGAKVTEQFLLSALCSEIVQKLFFCFDVAEQNICLTEN